MLALFLCAVGTSEAAGQQTSAGGLFLNPGADLQGPAVGGVRTAGAFQNSDMIVRSRLVDVDFSLLGGATSPTNEPDEWLPGTTIQLNLFADAAFVALLQYAELNPSGSYSWVGQVASDPLSSVSLVVDNGLMVGNVNTSRGTFQIRPAGTTHIVHQTDQSLYPPEADPIPVISPTGFGEPDIAAAADNGTRIDMMVVYTPSARAAAGGTAAIEALIDLAITETNTAYANSGITPRLRLVHKAEVSYVEHGGNQTFNNALAELRSTTDGVIDNVHTLRDTYGADAVQMLVNDSTYCGLAYRMVTQSASFASSAFAVTAYNCATGYYSFGHELGHNQGSHHDPYVTGGAPVLSPATPYFGFDAASDLELASPGFYVLDRFGGVHAGGGAPILSPATPYFGFDAAGDLELASSGHYVLDRFGGVHAGGGAPVLTLASPYWGFDVAGDLELAATGYYVLDRFGGVHRGGGAPAMSSTTPYFGWDVARDLELQ